MTDRMKNNQWDDQKYDQYYDHYYEKPPNKKNKTRLTCGIIAFIFLCIAAFLISRIARPQTNTRETGISDHSPYAAVVQIIAIVNMEGEVQYGWTGSGSVISPDGLILTSAHVVMHPDYEVVDLEIAITIAQDRPPEPKYYAKVVQANTALDLAVIKIDRDINFNPIEPSALNLPTIPLGNSDKLNLGDDLTILGYPGIGGETITLTSGKVSGFTGNPGMNGENRAFIKTNAAIAGGNSGGMALNSKNEMVGIPTQVGSGGEGEIVDCRPLADTNRDGRIDNQDSCIPTGGFINALRPINLALPLITAAERGEFNVQRSNTGQIQRTISGAIIHEDDFSSDTGQWATGTDEDGGIEYQNGELRFTINSKGYYFWSTLYTEKKY